MGSLMMEVPHELTERQAAITGFGQAHLQDGSTKGAAAPTTTDASAYRPRLLTLRSVSSRHSARIPRGQDLEQASDPDYARISADEHSALETPPDFTGHAPHRPPAGGITVPAEVHDCHHPHTRLRGDPPYVRR